MKTAILLYNPKAGHRVIMTHLDYIAKRIQQYGYELHLYRSTAPGDIRSYLKGNITRKNTDLILISGGDGTINECVTGILENHLDIPLLILPLGTANDFANSAKIPMGIKECLNLVEEGELSYIDVGKANEKYFINVCNMGLFSGVSHNVDLEMKKKFGRLAYYVKGLEEIQKYQAMDLTITTDKEVLKGKYVLVLVFNGKGAGGFLKLAEEADIADGMFNMVCIKDVTFFDVPGLFLKVLQGEHLRDSKIDYLTTNKVSIVCHNQEQKHFITDVDGEEGPEFPIHIEVIPNKLRVFLPKIKY